MSKKKIITESKVEPKKIFTAEEIEAALQITHSEYFMQVIALLSNSQELTPLSYVKVPVTTPDGGVYLVSILHIEGPRIDLAKLAAAAEAQEKEKG